MRPWGGIAAALVAATAAPVQASAFKVDPVRVVADASGRPAALTLTNEDDQPVAVQVSIVRWSQEEGRDIRAATTDWVLNPPIARIAPHARQLLRLALRHPLPQAVEGSYRLEIEELPQGPAVPGQIRTLLRLDLPVFVPPAAAKAALSAEGAAGGVTVRNGGNVHVQVRRWTLLRAGAFVQHSTQPFYLLPGAARTIAVPPGAAADQLMADSDQGPMRIAIAAAATQRDGAR